MQHRTRSDCYKQFINFVESEIRVQRSAVNRKMFNVVFWCFLLPALASITLILLLKFGVLSKASRNYVEWVILFFPVSYSLYILGSQGVKEVISGFRKGAAVSALNQTRIEGSWREQVMEKMKRAFNFSKGEWSWVVENFQMDLKSVEFRSRSMTVLAGAVFFFILQGLDLLDPEMETVIEMNTFSFMNLVGSGLDKLAQLVALGLFLILINLSGAETLESLKKYLNGAKLLAERIGEEESLETPHQKDGRG